jgi:trans-aconitate 2-methyltransferase
MSDWDPDLYSRFSQYRAEPVLMMLEGLRLKPREQIVDLGCGMGEHTVELARRTDEGRVLGIDSSPAMIERALRLHQTLDPDVRERVQFKLADFRDFQADGEYTVVFSNAALQWANGHRRILAAVHRALRENGRLAVQIPANENETAQLCMRQMASEPPWNSILGAIQTPSAENVLAAAEYHRILSEIGFAEVNCFYHTFHHPMQSPAEVVEFCRSTSLRPFLHRVPPIQHSSFVAELIRRLEAEYGTSGPLTFNFRRLFLWARRPQDLRHYAN